MSDLVDLRTSNLTSAQYSDLADVPPEVEWLANITNNKTRRSYKEDVAEFVAFSGLKDSAQLRTVARSHVIAWRKDMESRLLSAASIRRKLSALSSLFNYLCERNAVLGNPVDGVKRPLANSNGYEALAEKVGRTRCIRGKRLAKNGSRLDDLFETGRHYDRCSS
jgi:hypothetical protein